MRGLRHLRGDRQRGRAAGARRRGLGEFEGHSPHRPWVDAVKITCDDVRQGGQPHPRRRQPLARRRHRAASRRCTTAAIASTGGEWFPADFITEGFPGQFRNWFYSLLVMAAALEDDAPFKTLLGYGTLLDEKGEEFHKSKGNSIPFDEAAAIVGSDTMRWLFVTSHTAEQDLRFPRIPTESEAAEARARRPAAAALAISGCRRGRPLDKLWNVYSFFVTYANIDGFNPTTRYLPVSERSDLDRWVLSELQETIQAVEDGSGGLRHAARGHGARALHREPLELVRAASAAAASGRARRTPTRCAAYLTLYECLVTVTKLLAPLTPFLAESLYQNLVRSVDDGKAPESVHLCDWPVADASLISPRLRDETALVHAAGDPGPRGAREGADPRAAAVSACSTSASASEESARRLQRLADQVLGGAQRQAAGAAAARERHAALHRAAADGRARSEARPPAAEGAGRAALWRTRRQRRRTLHDTGRLLLSVEGQTVELTAG